jgi:predicted MFS family arabinose efflux permease
VVYLVSTLFADAPGTAVGVLVAARLLVGVAEGFFITGMLSWGVARLGPAHAGKVIGWVGVALFAAYGAGAPLGVWVMERFGFAGVGVASLLIPLVALAGTWCIAGVAPGTAARPPIHRVIGAIRLPGLALTFTAAGFAMINAFVPLLFAQRGWGTGALAISSMGAGFIIARMLLGHLPDKVGGARVALFCVAGEAVGLLMIWAAPTAWVACAGALLAGGGYAIGFQGFGVEAVNRTPPQSRGSAMGAYVAFQDVCMGLAAPLGGVLAHAAGVDAVYLAAAVAAMGAAVLAGVMVRRAT